MNLHSSYGELRMNGILHNGEDALPLKRVIFLSYHFSM